MEKTCICGREGTIQRGSQWLCQFCFTEQIEKRIKRSLKVRPIQKSDKVLVVGKLAEYVVRKIIKVPASFEYVGEQKEGFDVIIIPWTADDEGIIFLKSFAEKQRVQEEPNTIKAFRYATDADMVEYAKLHNIQFTPNEKDKNWQSFLERFPQETRYNLLRNMDEMKELLK